MTSCGMLSAYGRSLLPTSWKLLTRTFASTPPPALIPGKMGAGSRTDISA
eukprot:CAMPEP_0173398292 /NCGR_PEP_ID=MMETSP1356-20130122/41076_2 /TAXON_ID=77927 ORGANISM="Hemiselmis virescens, Strain PCC157" /NCGR_SAMPLE_ID=MMETSP1356 /ASSEMBLY_ACC=CAM_ASM_000847 /LENGTH=49 /DNA_ID= /DNA_START= /DNA_END= /DNA_ORIENTATION=